MRIAPDETTQDASPTVGEAASGAARRIKELRAFAAHYAEAKKDGVVTSLKRVAFYAILGLLGAVIGVTLLITATVLLTMSLAEALGSAFPRGYAWAGAMIVGFVIVAGALAGAWIVVSKMLGSSYRQTVSKYESRHTEQRAEFGHDVTEAR